MSVILQEKPWQLRSARDVGARILAAATASHGRAVSVLVLFSALTFLPGFFNVPPVDRDEALFAQATKQMIETGDYVDIRFQDEVRYKKPVGIYWLQAGVVRTAEALGFPDATTTIWLYRVPSLLGAIGAVLMTYSTALTFGSRRTAFLAALMLASSILLGVEARLAKTDAMLLFTIVSVMGVLARSWFADPESGRGWRDPAIFWTALAAGVLLKGPLILMIVGLAATTLAILDRRVSWLGRLRPAPGIVWILLLVLPWFVAIVNRAGESFFVEAVGRDLLGKVTTGQQTHFGPPGYYLVLFWATFWPAAPLAALAAASVWRGRREAATKFLLAWLVPSWIVFELVATKLPHYVLPLYPAVAILIARAIEQDALSKDRRVVRTLVQWPVIPGLMLLIAVAGLVILRRQLGLLAWPFAGVAMIFGFVAWRFYDTDGAARSFLRAAVASALLSVAVFGVITPLLRPLFPSAWVADSMDTRCDPQFASAGYHEPSVVFLLGTDTRLTDGAGAADFLREGSCRFALIEARQERAFVQRAEAISLRYALSQKIEAINYNGGRWMTISVYRSGDTR
ncbi:MAG TPA: glycosyltransferase family 39 protein [Xanthobacteraceae bacterium]|nr:glycosyltransferase family 39 protein [Xanthobacteraceae bacterium]